MTVSFDQMTRQYIKKKVPINFTNELPLIIKNFPEKVLKIEVIDLGVKSYLVAWLNLKLDSNSSQNQQQVSQDRIILYNSDNFEELDSISFTPIEKVTN